MPLAAPLSGAASVAIRNSGLPSAAEVYQAADS